MCFFWLGHLFFSQPKVRWFVSDEKMDPFGGGWIVSTIQPGVFSPKMAIANCEPSYW